jgi:glycosyltransferase involved in cell wall biosynthesis
MTAAETPPGPGRTLGLLSVVAPMYDEEGTAEQFYSRVVSALAGIPFELILVDDCSSDATPRILDRLAANDPRVRVIFLSRNFGHQAALSAGLDHARGDAVAMLDGDLQDPPELIRDMLERWREGYEVVYAKRIRREGETRMKLATARWFYRLFAKLTRLDLEGNAGDFRLLDRAALDSLTSMRERNRFLRGMTVWIGYRQIGVPYERDARLAGETKYTWRKMFRFAVDAISSFSWIPLQAATALGFVFSIVAFLALPLVIVARIVNSPVHGVSTVLFIVLLMGGIQLITVGIIGEYVGRIYDEVKGRPLYIVRDQRNMEAGDEDPDGGRPEPATASRLDP